MWFKNLQIFKYQEPVAYEPEQLETKLANQEFKPCSNIVPVSIGWTAPIDQPEAPLVHAANGFMMLCLKIEEKLLPGSVIREHLQDRIAHIEMEQGRKVYKNEKESIKDDIYQTLLPRAFTKSTRVYAYIDTQQGWLFVDAASHKKAEEFCSFLRKTLGSLKIEIPETQSPSALMTHWLKENKAPANFNIGDDCVLQDTDDDGGTVRCQRQDLFATNIQSLLKPGRVVTALALHWMDHVSLMLQDDFSFKRLKFLDAVKEQVNDTFTETAQERFDTDFVIMTETLRPMFDGLFEALTKSQKTSTPKTAPTKEELEPA